MDLNFNPSFDLRHWLFGLNWGNDEHRFGIRFFAIHFGPICLLWAGDVPPIKKLMEQT